MSIGDLVKANGLKAEIEKARIWASRLQFELKGKNLCLKAGICASRLGFGPHDLNVGLKAGILASRQGFEH